MECSACSTTTSAPALENWIELDLEYIGFFEKIVKHIIEYSSVLFYNVSPMKSKHMMLISTESI